MLPSLSSVAIKKDGAFILRIILLFTVASWLWASVKGCTKKLAFEHWTRKFKNKISTHEYKIKCENKWFPLVLPFQGTKALLLKISKCRELSFFCFCLKNCDRIHWLKDFMSSMLQFFNLDGRPQYEIYAPTLLSWFNVIGDWPDKQAMSVVCWHSL